MTEILGLIITNSSEIASIVCLPATLWLMRECKKQSSGLMASLKFQLKELHTRGQQEIKSSRRLQACTKELFYTLYEQYEKLQGNGIAKSWKADFDRWSEK